MAEAAKKWSAKEDLAQTNVHYHNVICQDVLKILIRKILPNLSPRDRQHELKGEAERMERSLWLFTDSYLCTLKLFNIG
jgi:hypothetical protein